MPGMPWRQEANIISREEGNSDDFGHVTSGVKFIEDRQPK